MAPRESGAQDAALHEAQGALRDAVSAAQNFLVLLRSLRVGPRAIAPLLTEVRSSIGATPGALSVLLRLVKLDQEPASRVLLSYLEGNASETCRALLAAEASPVEARSRLALEATFSQFVPRLDAARELAELLVLLDAPVVELDLAELLEATSAPASRTGLVDPAIQLHIVPPRRGSLPVKAPPRAALRLLRLVLGFVRGGPDHGWSIPRASLRLRPSLDRVDCVFQACSPQDPDDPGASREDALQVHVPLFIPPAIPLLALYCERTHICFSADQPPLPTLLSFAHT